jgi:hypothetical protein
MIGKGTINNNIDCPFCNNCHKLCFLIKKNCICNKRDERNGKSKREETSQAIKTTTI